MLDAPSFLVYINGKSVYAKGALKMITASILRFFGRLCLIGGGVTAVLSLTPLFFNPVFNYGAGHAAFMPNLMPISMGMMGGGYFGTAFLCLVVGIAGWAVFAALAKLAKDIAVARTQPQ